MSYRLRTLGSIRILGDDGTEVQLRSAKHTALFVYLNASARRTHLRAELCHLLWTTEEARARHSLSQALYDIRTRIGSVVEAGGGDGVSLDAPGAWYDVDEFEERVAGDDAAGAVELYRGPFGIELDEVGTSKFEFWLESERQRLRTVGRSAFRQRIEELEEQGRWSLLGDVSRRFLKRAPDDVDAQRAFVRSLWLGGDRVSALEHFSSLRERRPDLAEHLLPLMERIEGKTPGKVREVPEPAERRLVGREEELARLRRISRDLGEPRIVSLLGEAGIGKTRLVQELRKVLELDGFLGVRSRCWEAEADVPYSAVAEGLEPWLGFDPEGATTGSGPTATARAALFPRVGEAGDPASGREGLEELRRRVFEEVTAFVRELVGDRPALWVVEDVQWIDRTSASLFHYLLRRLDDVPLLLVFTSRPSPDRVDRLGRFLDRRNGMERVRLGPLGESAVRELLEEASKVEISSGVRDRITELAGGNPYFALELLRALGERGRLDAPGDAPVFAPDVVDDRLDGVLRERLRGISVEGLKVLEALAVLGGRAPWPRVLSLAGVEVDDPSWICDQLGRQGLLRTSGRRVEFVHDIIRELIYADLGDVRRYSLHQMTAELLAREGEASHGVLAKHFHLGGDPNRAFHYALAAARDAERRGAHQEAATYADVALSASHEERSGREIELRRLAARAHSSSGQLAEAERRLEPLLRLRGEGRTEPEVRGLLELAEIQVEEARLEEAGASLLRVEEATASGAVGWPSEPVTADRLSMELLVEIHRGDRSSIDAAGERLRRFLAAREVAPHESPRAALTLAVYLATFVSSRQARELVESISSGELSGALRLRADLVLGNVALRTADWDRSEVLFRRGTEESAKRSDVMWAGRFQNNLGCVYMEQGRWDEGNRAFDRSLRYHAPLPAHAQSRFNALTNRADSALYQLHTSEARDRYESLVSLAEEAGASKVAARLRSCLGLIALQRGDHRAADRQYGLVRELVADRSLSQEGFKVDWFHAFCGGNGDARALLRDRAGGYRETDTISHLKLVWLGELGDEDRQPDEQTRRELRDRGLLWFEKFAERWIRAVRGNRDAR